MPAESLVKVAVEALVYLSLAGLTSAVVALLLPRARRLGRETLTRAGLAGTVGGFVIAELWAQFSHRERFANSTFAICVLAAALSALVVMLVQRQSSAADRLRD